MIPASFKLRAEKETLSPGVSSPLPWPEAILGGCGEQGERVGYCFAVRLVVITDDRMRSHAGATQRATEAGFRPGAVPLVRQ